MLAFSQDASTSATSLQLAPAVESPVIEVRDSNVVQLPDRKVTIHRIADPGLPDPRPQIPETREPSDEELTAFHRSPEVQPWLEQESKTTHLFISATVVDDRATFLRWWHGGAEYQAWSNADWRVFTGFAECQKGDKHFVSLLMAGSMSSAGLPADSPYRIPENLPTDPGTYQVIQGDLTHGEPYEGITAFHELYRSDYARLKTAYDLRERRRIEREAELRAHPPQPEDIVLHYWKVQPKRRLGNAEGGAR